MLKEYNIINITLTCFKSWCLLDNTVMESFWGLHFQVSNLDLETLYLTYKSLMTNAYAWIARGMIFAR